MCANVIEVCAPPHNHNRQHVSDQLGMNLFRTCNTCAETRSMHTGRFLRTAFYGRASRCASRSAHLRSNLSCFSCEIATEHIHVPTHRSVLREAIAKRFRAQQNVRPDQSNGNDTRHHCAPMGVVNMSWVLRNRRRPENNRKCPVNHYPANNRSCPE
jgi:hypothetical protein